MRDNKLEQIHPNILYIRGHHISLFESYFLLAFESSAHKSFRFQEMEVYLDVVYPNQMPEMRRMQSLLLNFVIFFDKFTFTYHSGVGFLASMLGDDELL